MQVQGQDKIVVFTGQSITPQLITTDIEVGYNSVATLARPQIDNGTAQVAVASRRELDDNIDFWYICSCYNRRQM